MSSIRAFTMPKWGIEMVEGVVGEWKIAEGEAFTKGQIIALIESDKITNEVEAEFDSALRRIVATEGETYPVGALLAVFAPLDVPQADIDAFVGAFRGLDGKPVVSGAVSAPAPASPAVAPAAAIPADARISPAARALAERTGVDVGAIAGSGRGGRITLQDVDQASKPARPVGGNGPVSVDVTTASVEGVYASPMAKRLAVLHGVELAGITGTGARGRIRKADVLAVIDARAPAATPAPAPSAGVEVVRMSPMRKAIARRLTESKTTIPHFYLRMDVRMDALLALRERVNMLRGTRCSINDYLVRAVALALRQCPDVNIQVHGDEIHRLPHADIAVAVATDKGLLTPIVRAADTKTVTQIAEEVRALAARARDGKLQPAEFEGGSFSLSNLGMFGIDQFDAIINPPQGAILAVGATRRTPIETGYALAFASMLSLSLSCDHRAIDGAVGAQFMSVLRGLIEKPDRLAD
ncbi:2-oxo acid dehydrogenase subunit E2 [Parapedomonas caeni]